MGGPDRRPGQRALWEAMDLAHWAWQVLDRASRRVRHLELRLEALWMRRRL